MTQASERAAAAPHVTAFTDLSADGLVLNAWRAGDAADVLAIAADPATRSWSGSMRPLHTEDDARAWLDRRTSDPDRVEWAVRDDVTGDLAGRVGLHRFDLQSRTAEIGYAVHPAHRRRGVARRAVQAVTRHGFAALGLNRIALIHATGNSASCAVAAASGYAFEGVERQLYDHGDGVLHDYHRHARLAGDPPGEAPRPPSPLEPVEVPVNGDLVLRPWRASDADAVLRGLSDPLVARWNPRLPLRDLAGAQAWLVGRAERWADGRAASWAVVAGARVLGSVGLRDINRIDDFAVASYWTMPEARGRGVAVRALARATSYAFGTLGMHRVELGHAVVNTASCRVAMKAGFLLEGTLRESNRVADGLVDQHLHARLATDPPVGEPAVRP